MNIADELDRLFHAEPPLPTPEQRLYAGRRALRRRRMIGGAGLAAAAVVLGGTAWTVAGTGDDVTRSGDSLVVADPTTDPAELTASIPLRVWSCDDPCLGDTWSPYEPATVEDGRLVHERETPFLGWEDGRLVRYRDDFLVTGIIVDPFQAGATGTAGVEVEHEGVRHRVLMANGFGFQASRVRDGSPATLADWVRQTPSQGGCGGQLAEDAVTGEQVELSGCPTVVDGAARPPRGTTVIDRLADPASLEQFAHPGASVDAWLVESEGTRWYVMVEWIVDGRMYDADFAPAPDTMTLRDWTVARLTDAPPAEAR